MPVDDARIDAPRARRLDLCRARVDADHLAAACRELRRDHAVATPEIKDALARDGREELDDRRP